jgi:hypothetical protein
MCPTQWTVFNVIFSVAPHYVVTKDERRLDSELHKTQSSQSLEFNYQNIKPQGSEIKQQIIGHSKKESGVAGRSEVISTRQIA